MQVVSWDDASRSTSGWGGLSTVGPNITDTYLTARDGTRLFTLRSDNWNERLGRVRSDDVAVLPLAQGGGGSGGGSGGASMTLRDLLKTSGRFGGYAGLAPHADLADDVLDQECSIRFQTTFLPTTAGRSLEFTSECYNYQTRSRQDPKNLLLLCTAQGTAFQQDEGLRKQRLFHHVVESSGRVAQHWLEAERSHHAVGGAQFETQAEREAALRRGKATAEVLGTRAMGTRFNVLMTVQVPLRQKHQQRPPPPPPAMGLAWPAAAGGPTSTFLSPASTSSFAMAGGAAAAPQAFPSWSTQTFGGPLPPSTMPHRRPLEERQAVGQASAARVSIGSMQGYGSKLAVSDPRRHPSEHVTITVVLYYLVTGGVPSEADVVAAIDDLEQLYKSCEAQGRRVDPALAFANAPAPATAPPAVFEPPVQAPPVQAGGGQFTIAGREPSRITQVHPRLPLSEAGFLFLHDQVGLALLAQDSTASTAAASGGEALLEAYQAFRLADDLHVQLHGIPSPSALYNIACCFARMARDCPHLVDRARPRVGPVGTSADTMRALALDLAVRWLRLAVAGGYADVANMQGDPDLSLVQSQRSSDLQAILTLASALNGA